MCGNHNPPLFSFLFICHTLVTCNYHDNIFFYYLNKIDTQKLQSEEFSLMTACCSNLATSPGISTAQAVGADDWEEKQPRAIPESFHPPDQGTFQQDIEYDASTSGSQSAKKLDKRKISESNAEHGTRICSFFYCSVLNILECIEGKKNSLSFLNYTGCLKSWCILVTTI